MTLYFQCHPAKGSGRCRCYAALGKTLLRVIMRNKLDLSFWKDSLFSQQWMQSYRANHCPAETTKRQNRRLLFLCRLIFKPLNPTASILKYLLSQSGLRFQCFSRPRCYRVLTLNSAIVRLRFLLQKILAAVFLNSLYAHKAPVSLALFLSSRIFLGVAAAPAVRTIRQFRKMFRMFLTSPCKRTRQIVTIRVS